jgi:hypothetical protein
MKHGKDTETGKKQQQQLQFGEAKILNKQNKKKQTHLEKVKIECW